jgi:hypothetical protein
MYKQKWEQLLNRYYAGETTLEEERYIRAKLLEEGDDHSTEGKLAAYFAKEQNVELSPTVAARIRQWITGKTARQRQIRSWLALAAAVLLAVSFWFMQPELTSVVNGEPEVAATDWSKYEVEDPEAAAAIIMQSLHSVSTNFRAGKNALQGITNAASLREPLN